LVEVAPGIDIDRDILAHMAFRPLIREPETMDEAIFLPEPMALRERMLTLPLDKRFSYDPKLNMLFIDFERIAIRSERDVARIKSAVERIVKPLGHKVSAIVNYNGATIEPAVSEIYAAMVEGLVTTYYSNVTRYGTSGFLKMKLASTGNDV